jgi:type VI protein secretion system component VasK
MYRVIGPTAVVALLVLFLVGILRMLLDIVIRAIAIARVRGCGWWLMGAFLGTLFQVAVAPVSYQMTAKAARLEIEDSEAQRLTIEEVDGPSAPKVQINNLDRLVNRSNEFLGRRDNDRV